MSNISCKSCSKQIPANSKFCPECGVAISTGNKKKPVKSTALRDTLIVGGILAVVVIGYLLVNQPEQPVVPQQQSQQTNYEGHPDVEMDSDMATLLNTLPNNYADLVIMGNNTMDQGNFPVASECYKRALALDPSSVDVRTDYGACLHGMGLPDRAAEEFRRVLSESPTHTIATFNLGIVHRTLNNLDSARYYWEKFLILSPEGPVAEQARAHLKELP